MMKTTQLLILLGVVAVSVTMVNVFLMYDVTLGDLTSFDCAKQFDNLVETYQNLPKSLTSQQVENFNDIGNSFRDNNCMLTSDTWKNNVFYVQEFNEMDWNLLEYMNMEYNKTQ